MISVGVEASRGGGLGQQTFTRDKRKVPSALVI